MAKQAIHAGRRAFKHQGQVIYEWEQSLEEVNIFIKPPPGVTASHLLCTIAPSHVMLGIKGNAERYLDHELTSQVVVAESYWMLDGGELNINLQKMKKGLTWDAVFVGHGELDPLTKDEVQKKLLLERFQQENPGFDFSNAEFNGSAPDARTFMGGVRYN
ncbi:hypothetical protein SDRG_05185 [Saprolegnia diclina VS20]|uniref:CS domain-containing protein n=1 Tax=Saprolegnia diclina (strain VS20) TaxID=1156394 RepID=T0QHY6_SAPDV|nr:hypothetical protein SDRG_05185 [Saprolegnia diclina VS20]EQC37589.1 hypothetical protein SDRG_05185 [Saprolegnia diclina VS20]|eukprot:XP_008609109.1 hypothetical protein SDRG_05185 [Saprolegnia diclina VS20]